MTKAIKQQATATMAHVTLVGAHQGIQLVYKLLSKLAANSYRSWLRRLQGTL